MAQAFAKGSISAQPEYSVYIYHRPENQHEGQNDWEMRAHTVDLNAALDEAETLYQSKSYRKIEVKQRIMDPRTKQVRDYTLKIFADEKNKIALKIWLSAIVTLIGAGAVIWGLTHIF